MTDTLNPARVMQVFSGACAVCFGDDNLVWDKDKYICQECLGKAPKLISYTGFIQVDGMTDPETFEFEAAEGLSEQELDDVAFDALWESGKIEWRYERN